MVWVNFLPWRHQQLMKQGRRWAVVFFLVLSIAITAIAFAGGQHGVNTQQKQLVRQIKESRVTLSEAINLRETRRRQRQTLHGALSALQQLHTALAGWHAFFAGFPAHMPDRLWLTEIERKADVLTLSGQGEGMADIEHFHLQMQRWPLFSQVEMAQIGRDPQGTMRFTLHAPLRAEESSSE